MLPFVLFHDVETSLPARSNSSQSDPLPGNCFTLGNLLNDDSCSESINGPSNLRVAPATHAMLTVNLFASHAFKAERSLSHSLFR